MSRTTEDFVSDTEWASIRWPIALSTPPEIVSLGIGTHGYQSKESYLLSDLWCFHLYPYSARVRLGSRLFPIRPGFAGLIPPNTPIEYDYPSISQHLFVHFRCTSSPANEQILAMQDMGTDFTRCYGRLEQVIQSVGIPSYRVQSHIWDILCQLTERAGNSEVETPTTHPAVQYVVSQIELRIGGTLSVADLARETYVSYSYLGRLFQLAFGTTVIGYIRSRRMERARHLLQHSTLPIKVIAATVGIPDLHLFNKTVRQTFGKSPRALRQLSDDSSVFPG